MIRFALLLSLSFLGQVPAGTQDAPPGKARPLEKSEYFAFVDHDYVFTIEVVDPGVVLFNFVSMTDQEISLPAKNLHFALENRKVPGKLFAIETGVENKPMMLLSLTMHPRSSFGVEVKGDFDQVKQLNGVTLKIGSDDFKLAPLDSYDFESLVLKANHLNLGSPDFNEDWHVLKMELIGTRSAAGRRKDR